MKKFRFPLQERRKMTFVKADGTHLDLYIPKITFWLLKNCGFSYAWGKNENLRGKKFKYMVFDEFVIPKEEIGRK